MNDGLLYQIIFALVFTSGFVALLYAVIKRTVVPAYCAAALSVPISLLLSGYQGAYYLPLLFPILILIGCFFLKRNKNHLALLFFAPFMIESFVIIVFGLVLDVW